MPLPVADRWYHSEEAEPGLTLIQEPHVDVLERSNLWHLRGRDRDLLIDGGMGIVPLRPAFPALFEREPVAVATHTHLDHVGALHEFAERWAHPAEADALAHPKPASLISADLDPELRQMFVAAGYPALGDYMVDALPYAGYDLRGYRLMPAPATRLLAEGDAVDTGDRQFTVMHLPGHSPGGIALWEAATGTLFAGDTIYDGPLLYEGRGMDVSDYARSLRRLRDLPVRVVHAGHDPSFGRERMLQIIDVYLRRWGEA